MPFEIACGACGSTLYWGMELRSPRDVLRVRHVRCENCGAKLSTDFTVDVTRITNMAEAAPNWPKRKHELVTLVQQEVTEE